MERPDPRVTVIEGRRTLIVERRPPLPSRLDVLLSGLRVYPIRITGWRSECSEQEHRFVMFAEGSYPCLDGMRRDLRLFMCRDCESVAVRDVTVDRLSGLPIGRTAPRRRNAAFAWYSGTRRSRREYR